MTLQWGNGQYTARHGCTSEGPGLTGTLWSLTKVNASPAPGDKHRLGDGWVLGNNKLTMGQQCPLHDKESQQWVQGSDLSPLWYLCYHNWSNICLQLGSPVQGTRCIEERLSKPCLCSLERGREGSGMTLVLPATTWSEDTKKLEANSSQSCMVTGQEATDASSNRGNSD